MNLTSFLRFTGFCLFIAGILFLSTAIFYYVSSLERIGTYIDLIGMALLLLGLVGLYIRQMNEVGVVGLIIFLIAFLGAVLWAGAGWSTTFILPVLDEQAPQILSDPPPALIGTGYGVSLYTFFGGMLLFALITAWKGILPRVAAILLAVVPILDFVPFGHFVSQPLAGVALIWLGYSLWKGNYEDVSTGN